MNMFKCENRKFSSLKLYTSHDHDDYANTVVERFDKLQLVLTC